jgi:transposase
MKPYHRTDPPGRLSIPPRAFEAEKLASEGIRIRDIADRFGVSVPAVNKWLTAIRELRREEQRCQR